MKLNAEWLPQGSQDIDTSNVTLKPIPNGMVLARPFRTFRTGKVFCRYTGEQRGRDEWTLEHVQGMKDYFYSPQAEPCPIDLEHEEFMVMGEVVGLFITAESDGSHALWAIPAYTPEGIGLVDLAKNKNLYSSPTLAYGGMFDARTGQEIESDILLAVALTLSPAQSKTVIDKVLLSEDKKETNKETKMATKKMKAPVKLKLAEEPVEKDVQSPSDDASGSKAKKDCECPEGEDCDCSEPSEDQAPADSDESAKAPESSEEAPKEDADSEAPAEEDKPSEEAPEDAQSPSDGASGSGAKASDEPEEDMADGDSEPLPEDESACECPEGEECDCPESEESPKSEDEPKEEMTKLSAKVMIESLSALKAELSTMKTKLSTVEKENTMLRKQAFSIKMDKEISVLLSKGTITPAEVESAKRAFTAEFTAKNPEKLIFRPFTEVYLSRVPGHKVDFSIISHGQPVNPGDSMDVEIQKLSKEKNIPYHVALKELLKNKK